jgi:hypothetical protein
MTVGPSQVSDARIEMSKWQWPMVRKCVGILACAFGILFLTAESPSVRDERDLKTLGLAYQVKELKEPRPNRVHILRVDLTNGKIRPAVVIGADPDRDGPAEAALTDPRKLASDPSVLAFVNTNPWSSFPDSSGKKNQRWFEGQPVDICGLAVSGGHVRSPGQPGAASVWVNSQGRVFLGDVLGDRPVEAMTGFGQIVREGAVIVPTGGAVHPRTAIGVDRNGTAMWLVVVDGRQEQYSEGMTLHEIGRLMLGLGCWNATNMDGGGSSIMGLVGKDGRLRVVNSPSDRHLGAPKIRPLPMILTIREK